MQYKVDGCDIVIAQSDFNLDETLDCGQAFRWEKVSNNTYSGFCLNKPLTISEDGEGLFRFHDTTEKDLLETWCDYFDFGTDYGEIKKTLSTDETLKKACLYAGGIRLLRQDRWEALCSFIISQNNNIPRIKGIISRLCEHYGGFPTYTQLAKETEQSLSFLRAGFRAKYLIDASVRLDSCEISLDELNKSEITVARQKLMTITGVGPKVAECAILYGMHRTEAFPLDVWIKRVMNIWYPDGLPQCTKGIEGIAQQYLFHYIRNLDKA